MSAQQSVAPDPVRVLHVTDPHLFDDRDGELRGVVTSLSLDSVLEDYRRADWRADIVLATGDIVQDDSAGGYRRFTQALDALDLPVYCVPGNHDVPALMLAEARRAGFFYCSGLRAGNWQLLGIDSCAPGQAGGRIRRKEMERLAAALGETEAGHVLVYLHHPPVPMHSRWLDEVGLANGTALLELLQRDGRVRLVLFGHVHQAYDEDIGDIRVIGTPSTCRQFAPRKNTFAVDDRPPAYRRIGLGQDGGVTTELCWVDVA